MKKLIITLSAIIFLALSCKKDKSEELIKPTKCLPLYKIDSIRKSDHYGWVVEYTTYEYSSNRQLSNIVVDLVDGYSSIDTYELVYDDNDRVSEVIRNRGKLENSYGKWILHYNDKNQLINYHTQVIVDEEPSGESSLLFTYEYPNENTASRVLYDEIYGSRATFELDENKNVAMAYYYNGTEKYLSSEYEFFCSDKMQPYSNWSFEQKLLFKKDLSINQNDSLIWTVHNYNGTTEDPKLIKPRPGVRAYNDLGYLTKDYGVAYEYMYY